MNIENLIAAVEDIIMRPDKSDLIVRSLRATIKHLHSSADYPQDLVEDYVQVQPSNLLKIPVPQRFRKLGAIVPVSAQGTPLRTYGNKPGYRNVQPSNIIGLHGNAITDVCYVAGSSFVIRAGTAPSALMVQYYQYPEVSDLYLETWITAEWPEMVINGTVHRVYQAMRQREAAGEFRDLFMMDYQNFLNTATSAGGL